MKFTYILLIIITFVFVKADAQSKKNSNLKIVNKEFKSGFTLQAIALKYKKKSHITFLNCKFETLSGSITKNAFWSLAAKKIEFIDCSFRDEVDLENGVIYGQLIFRNCDFQGIVATVGSEFHSKVSFAKSKFKNEGHFQSTYFFSSADFFDCKFQNALYFQQARFSKEATFSNSKFGGYTSFSQCVFSDLSYFNYTEYQHELHFNNVSCYLNSEWINSKIKKADFNQTIFHSKFFNDGMQTLEANFGGMKVIIKE